MDDVYSKLEPYLWDINNSERIAILSSLLQLGMINSIEAQEVLSSIEDIEMTEN